MKKKNTLVLAFCMAFAVSACAAGCAGGTGDTSDTPETHEHSYDTVWSSDESYHWHACTSTTGTCDAPQNSKAEHSWDNGVITQEATAEADGVKTFTCTVCSKTKTESIKYVAPIHEHDYATAWSSDESYHWHACTSTTGTCDAPQNSKAEHSWDNGVITQEATAEADGVKTFTCTVCSKTKTESIKYVAPIHEHDYATAWSSDESYHWHACTSTTGTCDAPQNSKAEHSWDNGVITQEATAEADGVKTFTCTVCSKTKTESIKYVAPAIELKEDTDFAALVSEQVTEDEWKTAFEITNVTIKVHDNKYNDAPDYLIEINGSEVIMSDAGNQNISYMNKLADGTIVMSYGGQTVSVAPDDANYQSMLEGYNYSLTWNYPDFSNFYSSFTYDSAKGAYVLNETVRTNSVFEGWDSDYDFAELKIINGKLAYVRWGDYGEGTTALNDKTEYFYDFGVTEITLPTA